jgi:hypothetical protein
MAVANNMLYKINNTEKPPQIKDAGMFLIIKGKCTIRNSWSSCIT